MSLNKLIEEEESFESNCNNEHIYRRDENLDLLEEGILLCLLLAHECVKFLFY